MQNSYSIEQLALANDEALKNAVNYVNKLGNNQRGVQERLEALRARDYYTNVKLDLNEKMLMQEKHNKSKII